MRVLTLLLTVPVVLSVCFEWPPAQRSTSSAQSTTTPTSSDPRALYALHCSPCHGERGRGDGPGARFLDPVPRDFHFGAFRLVSTKNGVPSDKDLLEVISAGIPGTAMLPFAFLPPADRAALVGVVREYRREGLRELYRDLASDEEELKSWILAESTPGEREDVSPEPPNTIDSRARGRLHFRALCSSCHGPDGRGGKLVDRFTAENREAFARDFTRGVLKGGVEPQNHFFRIRCGMPGTPMPAVPVSSLNDQGVWDLVHYLTTLIPVGAQDLHDPLGFDLPVLKIEGELPTEPEDPRFDQAPDLPIALAPFRSEENTVPGLMIRAVHNGRYITLRATWPDSTRNRPGSGAATPPDGLAVRLTRVENPPVLPIPGLPLPLDRALFLAGPMPLEDDPLFDGYDPRFKNPDGVCKSPIGPEKVGRGTWRDGLWTVVMSLDPDKAGEISKTATISASFAIFDGHHKRGPLPTSFSHWHSLKF